MIRYLILFFLIISGNLFSQVKKSVSELQRLYIIGNDICESEKKEHFCKAFQLYRNREFDSCYVYSNRALDYVTSTNEKDILFYIQGVSAINKKILKKALDNFSNISEKSSFENLKNLKLGWLNLNLKKYDKAKSYYLDWIKNSSKQDIVLSKDAYHNLALCYMHDKDFSNAKKYFNEEYNLIEKEDTLANIRFKMGLANVYYEQYLDDDAVPLFIEAYEQAKKFSNLELKKNSTENMAYVEKDRKHFDKSVSYFIETIKWKDSIWNRDRIWELTERDKKLALTQKESEIALQNEKLKRQKVVQKGLLFGASGLLIFLALLGFFYKKLQNQNSLITKQKEDLDIANNTKNYLFSVVSHDLRSPMNTIKYQHEQLKKHITTNNLEGIREANNTAITVTESTSHLLNNVLHWSLEQSNQMVFNDKESPLKPVLEHVLFDYENLIEANDVAIETNYIQNALVKIDKESIKIVLRNLLDNAVKYMNGKGKISIEMGIDDKDFAYISIQDTGIGITKERLEKINALQDVSIDKINRSEGVGLGLILCQMLVKKNKGILSFESKPNQGTKVIIQLPSVS